MELVQKSEVRDVLNSNAIIVKQKWHNAVNLNNKATLFNFEGKNLASLNRKANQQANKKLGKQLAMQSNKEGFYLGRLFYAQMVTDSIPYNTKKGTEYLLPKGTEVLVEVTNGGFRAYNLNGLVYYSLTAVKTSKHSFRLLRNEFKLTNKTVKFTQIGKGATHAVGFYSTQGTIMNGFRVPM